MRPSFFFVLRHRVCNQTGSRVSEFGLDSGGFPGRLGLFTQGTQPFRDFISEVLDAGEVDRQIVQFFQRPIFTLPVLKHSRSFLDESAPFQFGGTQNPIELPLPHNDVHFPTHPGVGKQFLNI